MELFVCPLCGNTDVDYLGVKNNTIYCRRCIEFNKEKAEKVKYDQLVVKPNIDYKLTPEQDRVAGEVVNNYLKGIDTLIYAVCGAGKTELVFSVITKALSLGQQIGFVIPRKEVVREIYERIKEAFPLIKTTSVYGGNSEILSGQIIVLTSHQLYRYENYFDLLIFDEIDAFPYAGDFVLSSLFKRSIKGHFVMMSATPKQKLIKQFEQNNGLVTLFSRFHNAAIPLPIVVYASFGVEYITLVFHLKRLLKLNKSVLIFVPTIRESKTVFRILSRLVKEGNIVHSKKEDKEVIINSFKKGNYKWLVTTTVLERGITIRGLQVIIFGAESNLYDEASLVQIAGRVGRKKDEPTGEVIYIARKKTTAISDSIKHINEKNANLQTLLAKKSI